MATTKFYLDSRSGGAPYPLKLTITHDRKAVHYPLGIKLEPEQWNGIMVVKHPRAGMLNNQLIAQKADIDTKLYEWQRAGKLGGKTAKEIKEMLEADERGEEPKVETFAEFFLRQADRKKKGTRDLYMATYRKLECYTNIEKLTFEDNSWWKKVPKAGVLKVADESSPHFGKYIGCNFTDVAIQRCLQDV